VPDWDNTESRESDEDAAWRDLVARFEEPVATAGPAPWPERENVPGQRRQPPSETDAVDEAESAPDGSGTGTGDAQDPAVPGPQGIGAAGDRDGAGEAPEPRGDDRERGAHGAEGIRGFDDEGVRGAFGADRLPGTHEPDVIQAARRDRSAATHGTRARRIRPRKAPPRPAQQADEGHYIPPAPPPLPKLDPITKGAWLALFGGPAYLVVATAADWSVPGIAAFFAVAAFVTGFAILVLRMRDPGPDGPDDGDDGAVV
jgi:hypothetical protein